MEYFALGILSGVILTPLINSFIEFLILVIECMKIFPMKGIDRHNNKQNVAEEKKDTMGFK
jgi:hypothetical protein